MPSLVYNLLHVLGSSGMPFSHTKMAMLGLGHGSLPNLADHTVDDIIS
jgi:hypothetical protein